MGSLASASAGLVLHPVANPAAMTVEAVRNCRREISGEFEPVCSESVGCRVIAEHNGRHQVEVQNKIERMHND